MGDAALIGAPPPTIVFTHIGSQAHDAGGSSSDSVSRSIGTASADRIVFALFRRNTTAAQHATAATIGGVTATLLTLGTSQSNFCALTLMYAKVPTGTSAMFAMNFNANVSQYALDVFTITGQDVDAHNDYDATTSGSLGSLSRSLDIPERGILIGISARGIESYGGWTAGVTSIMQSELQLSRLDVGTSTHDDAAPGTTLTNSSCRNLYGVTWI